MKKASGDTIFYAINYVLLTIILVIVLYPMIYIVSCSFSSSQAVISGEVWLWPVKPTLMGYETIFRNKDIMTGYSNSIFYTVCGTLLSVALTMLAAYPLSRSDFKLGGPIMLIFTFTMFFGGGIIPTYLLISSLGLINTRASMILPGAVGVYNIILSRTFLRSTIPSELLEAGQIDGCSDFRFFKAVVLPLSKAIIAVVALFYAVGYWNSYFSALIYLHDRAKYPLQLVLREILIQNKMTALEMSTGTMTPEEMAAKQALYELLKYSLIIVASLPVLCIYPFVQRYFVKGVMIGAIKG
ncbi:MAG: carbohydrate ABC transporter permease [Clostridiaceae bacterium]|nr:carbohydrate ABC transporter permease [Clostridiaceae bacterium]